MYPLWASALTLTLTLTLGVNRPLDIWLCDTLSNTLGYDTLTWPSFPTEFQIRPLSLFFDSQGGRGLWRCSSHKRPIGTVYSGVVSFTNPPVISGPGPENNGPPPLTLGERGGTLLTATLNILSPQLTCTFPLLSSPLTETFSIKLLKILNIFVANDTKLTKSDILSKKI